MELRKIRGARLEIPPLLEEIGAQLHYLDVAVRVNLHDHVVPQAINDAWSTIQDLKSLKCHFPHLTTCVLTLDVHCRLASAYAITHAGNAPAIPVLDKQLLQSACIPDRGHDFRTLNDALAKFFEVFADEGPGKSRFVRIRSHSVPGHYLMFDEPTEEHFSYGPLVRAERIDGEGTALGTRLVDAAYRLKRTGPRLPSREVLDL